MEDPRDRLRTPVDHLGDRAVRRRAPPRAHRPRPHDRRLARGHRRRRATPGDIDGIATYPGAGGGAGPGFSGPGTPEVQDALRLEVDWHSGGIEGAAQLAAVVNAVMAVGAGLARHVLVYRTVTESTEQGSGVAPGSASAPAAGAGTSAPHGRLDAVDHPLPGLLGGQLAGHQRPPPLPRVRHHPRAAGHDRHQRPPQRGAEPEGRLPRPDDARGLLPVPHDHQPVPAVRLRRPGGRVHRGDRLGGRARRERGPSGRPGRGGRHRAAGSSRRGTSTTT